MQTKIIILDPEIGAGLASYILNKNKMLSVVLCEHKERFMRAFSSEEDSIGVISEKMINDEMKAGPLKAKKEMLFELCTAGEEKDGRLFKYQPAEELLKKIYSKLIEHEIYIPGATGTLLGKEIISFISPHGYDGLADVSFLYALLQAGVKKTLFLNFGFYDGVFLDEGKDMGDFLYELNKSQVGAGFIAESMALTMGPLKYILPASEQMDIDELFGDDLARLTGRILRESDVEVLVLCLPQKPALLREAYRFSSRIISLRREGVVFEMAQSRLREELRDAGGENMSVMREVVIPKGFVPFVIKGDMYEQLLTSEPANFVREAL